MAELAHILVVDDDPSIRRMFQLLLTDTGYRVSSAASGEEALAYMDLITPDLILLDWMLPGIDGQEVTARIKADTTKPFIPIIVVTARGDQKSKVAALDAGADDFLVKPVEFAEMLARVRAMLRLQRIQRSLQAEQRKTELLLHLTRELGTTLDLDDLLTHFLDRLADSVGAVRASIILTNDDHPRLYSSTRARAAGGLESILRDGIAGWVLRERQPAIIDDTRNDERWIVTIEAQRVVRSVASVPISREGHVLGVITLVHHTPGYFTPEHLDLLDSVAAQSAIALENAELFRLTRVQKELLERRAEELQRINQVGRHLTELMSPDQLVRLVAQLVHHTFGYPHVTILLRDGNDLVIRASAGGSGFEVPLGKRIHAGQGITGWAATYQEAVAVGDVRKDPRYVTFGRNTTRSELAVPILTAREMFGVLNVESPEVDAFGPNDIRLLGTLTSQLSVALENAQLFDNEQRRVRQLAQVNNLSVAITAQLDSNENLRIAAGAIALLFGVDQCGIVVSSDERAGGVRVVTHSIQSAAASTRLRFSLPSPQIAAMLDVRAPEIIRDIADDQRLRPVLGLLVSAGVESLVLVPLMSSGRRIGLVIINSTGHVDQFGQAEVTLLETVASLIAQVLENARLYRTVEDERSTLNAVLGGAADPILLIGPQNQLLLANRAAHDVLGLSAETGQLIDTLVLQPDLLHAFSGSRNGDGTPPKEVTLPNGDTFSISVAPVRGADSELIGRVAVLQDITAIKELERQEQERLRSVFRRYVSPQVVEEVLAGGGDIGAPVEREVVVLFADLRGYTSLTEGLDPRVLVEQVLNRYFTAMTEVLYRHGGTIDKFLGDGIIGVFGSPIARDDDVQRALMAAVDLQRAFAEISAVWCAELGLSIGMGLGIGYGSAIVGNIGSVQRLDYTLIGDVVNTASRLNGLAEPGQIIISYHLIDALPDDWRPPWTLKPIGRVLLKGKQEPHLIYQVEYDAEEGPG